MTISQTRRVVSPRLPFPSSVYIFNGFYDDPALAEGNTSLLQFIRDHSSSLLRDIRLDLVVHDEGGRNHNDDAATTRWHRLYSRTVSSGTIQPVWHHLNERMDISEFSIEAYESMTLRFLVVDTEQQQSNGNDGILWLQLPIHPSKLVRIGRLPRPEKQHLPLNFIVIEYSDKSLRTTHSLHQLFESKGKKEDVENLLNVNEGESEDDHFGRFKDNAFSALDQVSAKAATSITDHADLLLPSIDRTFSLKLDQNQESENNSSRIQCSDIQEEKSAVLLQAEIEAQQLALMKEMKEIEDENRLMRRWEEELSAKLEQIRHVKDATEMERHRGLEITLKLQVQQIRLVRELQQIYPITVFVGGDARHRFRVRDVEFPATFQDMIMAPEDELSAVLGYTCHLIHMLSKYLSVQLPYRLLCHNSKSGIQDDRAMLYPLFYRRNVDKEQFEHGFTLLQRNVDCFSRERDLDVAPKLHILGKLKRVCDNVIDGY